VPVVRFVVARHKSTATPLARAYTVVYDGDCNVCTRISRALKKWDRNTLLEVVTSQTPGVQARFPWIPARAYRESLQLVSAQGETWQGAGAIEQLLKVLPRGRVIAWIFHVPFVRGLAEKFYRWFARNRYRLGCGEHCQLKPSDLDYLEDPK
jgi:predicted DCC family thiol-disulfide oxidoreductase YuxK